MSVRPALLACAAALLPSIAAAQTLNGAAEWSITRGTSESAGQPYDNDNLWQRYTVGYQAPLLDPRFIKYDTEVSFLTNSLSYGPAESTREGHQSTVGYKLGALMFPARPFPFSIQASRDTVGESGDYPSTGGIRGGIVVPNGAALPEFRTRNKSLSAGWQLTVPSLPRVELGYQNGNTSVSGGPYAAEQHNDVLHLNVFKETARRRQALRFQKSSYSNLLSTAFDQRLSDVDYELGLLLGRRSRFVSHAGRRASFSLFDLPAQVVDPGSQAYRPPSRGEITSLYATSGVTYEPTSRFSLSANGNADRQDATPVATNAALATTTARLEAFPGLSFNASGTYGARGQVFNDAAVNVVTRGAQAGATYHAGPRWLEGTVTISRGIGSNTTAEGDVGRLGSESRHAMLSSSFSNVTISAGYDRQRSHDDILDYGNFGSDRVLGSFQTLGAVVTFVGSWDHSVVTRGRAATFATNRQETFTASATYTFSRNSRISANAGGFTNRADIGLDRTLFWGGTYEAQPRPRLHVAATLRREVTTATQTHLDQRGLRGFGEAGYRLRLFTFAVEYRDDDQRLRYNPALEPYTFRGRQLLFRITRTFGIQL
jgi:hypothetical protein